MKYGLVIILIGAGVFCSCKKTNSSNANVLFYNATWSKPAITAAWNGDNIISTALAQGQSSGSADKPYLQIPAGTNLVTLKAGNDTLANKNVYTDASIGNSIFFFDTSIAAGSTVRILQVTDDLTEPDTAQIKYRFINLSPDTSATADVWLVNGVTDSIQLTTGSAFIGKSAVATSVPSFTAVKYHRETYTIKIKKAGTQTLFASIPGYVFTVRGVYSILFSGLSTGAGSTGFKLSVLYHQI
jgi:Domain of unknown function (DUF4397)